MSEQNEASYTELIEPRDESWVEIVPDPPVEVELVFGPLSPVRDGVRVCCSNRNETAIEIAKAVGYNMAMRRHTARDSRELARLIQAAIDKFDLAHIQTDWGHSDFYILVDEAAEQLYLEMISADVFE